MSDPIKDLPVEWLELSIRSQAVLKGVGVTNVGKLRRLTNDRIDEICGIAKKAATELKEARSAPTNFISPLALQRAKKLFATVDAGRAAGAELGLT